MEKMMKIYRYRHVRSKSKCLANLMMGAVVILGCNLGFAEEEVTLKLESTFVGDKEQPSVSYFIPWKEIGAPDQLNLNLHSKHDQSLEVVDREILLRSKTIYEELKMEAFSN